MTTKSKLGSLVAIASSALLLTACGGGAGKDIQEIPKPEPTSAATTGPEAIPKPGPTETATASQNDDPQSEDANPSALQVKVGDTLGVDIPNEMYDAEDGQGFTEWQFSASWTENISPYIPAEDGRDGLENYTLIGESLPDSSTNIFIIDGAGAGSISIAYTNPETGKTAEIQQEVYAIEEGSQ